MRGFGLAGLSAIRACGDDCARTRGNGPSNMLDMTLAEVLADLRPKYGRDTPSYLMLYRAIIEGRIPAEKPGKSWLIRREDMGRVVREMGLPARGLWA